MYTLTKEFRFEASHQLPHHDGKCARLHGHSWRLIVAVTGEELCTEGSKSGMLLDYARMKTVVQPLVDEYLDHWHLNDRLQIESPTSERIARWVYTELVSRFAEPVSLAWVEIGETCTSSCRYAP